MEKTITEKPEAPKKKKTRGKLIKDIIFWSVAGILGFYIASVAFFPRQAIEMYGFTTYVVTTDSMVPVIKVKDYIVVTHVTPDDLEVGDIVSFYADVNLDGKDEIVTHYLASIGTNDGVTYYKTHAYGRDDPTQWDYWVLYDHDIIGKYAFTIPVLGIIVSFLRSPLGIAVIVIDAVIIWVIVYLIDSEKKKKELPSPSSEPKK